MADYLRTCFLWITVATLGAPVWAQDSHSHAHAACHHGTATTCNHCRHHSHFDYLRPFETHSRGEEHEFGHSGHTSLGGYPYQHGIRTEIDFIERALELDLAYARDADDGQVDEWEFEAELVWAINNRTIFIVGAPVIFLEPVTGSETSGVGDMEVGVQFQAFNGERDLLFFALNATVPTGDPDRDLGAGHTVLEPTALWLHDFGGGTYFQSRFAWEVPVSVDPVANEFVYDTGLYHTLLGTEHWRHFRFLTPLIEVNGVTALNGADSGETVVDLTGGFRWIVRDLDELGAGVSFPVTGDQSFDWQAILSYRRHF